MVSKFSGTICHMLKQIPGWENIHRWLLSTSVELACARPLATQHKTRDMAVQSVANFFCKTRYNWRFMPFDPQHTPPPPFLPPKSRKWLTLVLGSNSQSVIHCMGKRLLDTLIATYHKLRHFTMPITVWFVNELFFMKMLLLLQSSFPQFSFLMYPTTLYTIIFTFFVFADVSKKSRNARGGPCLLLYCDA